MTNEMENLLGGLTPRGAPAELRSRVLGHVREELKAERKGLAARPRWDRVAAITVAAALAVGLLMNVWVVRSDDRRQARLFGPETVPRNIRETVEMAERVGGPEFGAALERRLVAAWRERRRQHAQRGDERYRRHITLVLTGELFDVPQIRQVDRNRPGQPDRSAVDRQRHLCVA